MEKAVKNIPNVNGPTILGENEVTGEADFSPENSMSFCQSFFAAHQSVSDMHNAISSLIKGWKTSAKGFSFNQTNLDLTKIGPQADSHFRVAQAEGDYMNNKLQDVQSSIRSMHNYNGSRPDAESIAKNRSKINQGIQGLSNSREGMHTWKNGLNNYLHAQNYESLPRLTATVDDSLARNGRGGLNDLIEMAATAMSSSIQAAGLPTQQASILTGNTQSIKEDVQQLKGLTLSSAEDTMDRIKVKLRGMSAVMGSYCSRKN
eukprot:m.216545 g.216545  ORF g.216545 m.216545 type:complete len:261 (+) comp39871_c0_seq3:2374-3156(+)